MAKIPVDHFHKKNPKIRIEDDGDGVVTPNDKAFLKKGGGEVELAWTDSRFVKARGRAEVGLKSMDNVGPWSAAFGIMFDAAASSALTTTSVAWAVFGGVFGNKDGPVARFANVWTLAPRILGRLGGNNRT